MHVPLSTATSLSLPESSGAPPESATVEEPLLEELPLEELLLEEPPLEEPLLEELPLEVLPLGEPLLEELPLEELLLDVAPPPEAPAADPSLDSLGFEAGELALQAAPSVTRARAQTRTDRGFVGSRMPWSSCKRRAKHAKHKGKADPRAEPQQRARFVALLCRKIWTNAPTLVAGRGLSVRPRMNFQGLLLQGEPRCAGYLSDRGVVVEARMADSLFTACRRAHGERQGEQRQLPLERAGRRRYGS
jgi:hypothetical protein